MLIMQWDGFVSDPAAWRPEFFEYDYIGPRWPWNEEPHNVGNGVFFRFARND